MPRAGAAAAAAAGRTCRARGAGHRGKPPCLPPTAARLPTCRRRHVRRARPRRPRHPILCLCESEAVQRRLALHHGVTAVRMDFGDRPEQTFDRCLAAQLSGVAWGGWGAGGERRCNGDGRHPGGMQPAHPRSPHTCQLCTLAPASPAPTVAAAGRWRSCATEATWRAGSRWCWCRAGAARSGAPPARTPSRRAGQGGGAPAHALHFFLVERDCPCCWRGAC